MDARESHLHTAAVQRIVSLRLHRAERSLSRQQLADSIGVDYQTVGCLERARLMVIGLAFALGGAGGRTSGAELRP